MCLFNSDLILERKSSFDVSYVLDYQVVIRISSTQDYCCNDMTSNYQSSSQMFALFAVLVALRF